MFLATQRLVSPDFLEGSALRASAKVLSDYPSVVQPRVPPTVNATQSLGVSGSAGELRLLTGGEARAPLLLTDGRGSAEVSEPGVIVPPHSRRPLIGKSPGEQLGTVHSGVVGAVNSVALSLSQRGATAGIASGESAEEFKRVQDMAALAQDGSRTVALRKAPPKVPQPSWHPPWKLMRVISGSLGWVRALAVEPGNEWFASGAGDRTIKIWDLASGKLKLTLTGHINTVRGIAISPRNPYMYSVGEDKMVKCWDLETNKVSLALPRV